MVCSSSLAYDSISLHPFFNATIAKAAPRMADRVTVIARLHMFVTRQNKVVLKKIIGKAFSTHPVLITVFNSPVQWKHLGLQEADGVLGC